MRLWRASSLFREAQEVASKLLGVEAHAEILYAENAAPIDDRCKKRVVHVAIRSRRGEYAVAACHFADRLPRAGKKRPAAEIGAERLRIFLQHHRRIALGVDRNGDEGDLGAEVAPEPVLNE